MSSLINENVDYWVPQSLWKKELSLIKEIRKQNRPHTAKRTFTTEMNAIFEEMWNQGVTHEEMYNLMKKTPVVRYTHFSAEETYAQNQNPLRSNFRKQLIILTLLLCDSSSC